MIDGFSITPDMLEELRVDVDADDRRRARALAAEGRTVGELAVLLDTNPMRAWWLSDGTAVNA